MLTPEDRSLMHTLLTRGGLSQEEIDQALRERDRLETSGEKLSLGQVLIRMQLLDIRAFSKMLEASKKKPEKCPICGSPLEDDSGKSRCEKCHFVEGQVMDGPALDNYIVIAEIARGGVGIVYRARQRAVNREVAVKVLKNIDEKSVKRFFQEIEIVGKLEHPNIVRVHDAGEQRGTYYLAMEYVDGGTLRQVMEKKSSDSKILKWMEQILTGIQFAHEHGIIHRDLKPENILLTKEGVPKISDFGLAKTVDRKASLTKTGLPMGTPYYMSPEQVEADRAIDHRTDIYSMGVILYETLSHRLPFTGKTIMSLYRKIVDHDFLPPRRLNRKISRDLESIILRAMAKDPRDRYQSARQFAEDISRFLHRKPVAARKGGLAAGLKALQRWKKYFLPLCCLLLLAIVAVLAVALLHKEKPARAPAPAPGRDFTAELHLAQKKIDALDFPGAVSELDRVVAAAPDHRQALSARAIAHYFSGNPSAAILDSERILSGKKSAEAHLYRGAARSKQGRHQEALDDFTEAIGLSPSLPRAFYYRGVSHYRLGDADKAVADFAEAARLDDNYFVCHCSLAIVLYEQKKLQEAIAALDRAQKVRPGNSLAPSLKITMYFNTCDFEAAAREVDTVIAEVEPQAERSPLEEEFLDGGPLLCSIAELPLTENYGLDMMSQMTSKGPEALARLYPNMAKVFYYFEAYEEMSLLVSQGMLLFPNNPDLIKWRGAASLGKGNYKSAISDLKTALKKDPDDWQALYFRGKAYLESGQKEQALADWQKSLEINPRQKRLAAELEKAVKR